MSSPAVASLRLQFLEWLAASPRVYGEVMEAWRTSCPRLSVWEDAVSDGLVEVRPRGAEAEAGAVSMKERAVALTERGRALVEGG